MKNTTQSRNDSLQVKFPAVKAALAQLAKDGIKQDDASKDRLHIRVERLNRDMLTATTVLCSGKGASLCRPGVPDRLGWQHEVYVAADRKGKILGSIGAWQADNDKRDKRQLKQLLLTHRDQIALVVRLTVTGWCRRLKNEASKARPLGELLEREIEVTVFQAPKEGIKPMLDRSWSDDSLRLHFANQFDAPASNPDALLFCERLYDDVMAFETATFFAGFKDMLKSPETHGEGQLGEVTYTYSVWEDGNKVEVRFTKGDNYIGFFYSGAENSMYYNDGHLMVSALDATVTEARALLAEVNKAFSLVWRPTKSERKDKT